jgi:reactive intermediate/imine deaminase
LDRPVREEKDAAAHPQPIVTQDAPTPKAAYSQGIDAGVLVMVSGQLGVDPSTGEIPDDVGNETRLVMNHIRAVLAAANLSMDDVCKTTIFMTNFEDYGTVNEVYGEYFETLPARSTVKVAELLMGARVEIEAIAVRRS